MQVNVDKNNTDNYQTKNLNNCNALHSYGNCDIFFPVK